MVWMSIWGHFADMRMWFVTGSTKDGESVSGTINIPEIAHDTEEDEYVVRSISQSPAYSVVNVDS